MRLSFNDFLNYFIFETIYSYDYLCQNIFPHLLTIEHSIAGLNNKTKHFTVWL